MSNYNIIFKKLKILFIYLLLKLKTMNELMNLRTIELLNEVLNKLNKEFDLVNDFSIEEVKYYIKIHNLIEEIELNREVKL